MFVHTLGQGREKAWLRLLQIWHWKSFTCFIRSHQNIFSWLIICLFYYPPNPTHSDMTCLTCPGTQSSVELSTPKPPAASKPFVIDLRVEQVFHDWSELSKHFMIGQSWANLSSLIRVEQTFHEWSKSSKPFIDHFNDFIDQSGCQQVFHDWSELVWGWWRSPTSGRASFLAALRKSKDEQQLEEEEDIWHLCFWQLTAENWQWQLRAGSW